MNWQPLPDVTPAQQEAAAIEVWVDRLAAFHQLDDAGFVHLSEELRGRVVRALDREARGEVQTSTWSIVTAWGEQGWYPAALPVESSPPGCVHHVQAPDPVFGQLYAIQVHQQQCLGR